MSNEKVVEIKGLFDRAIEILDGGSHLPFSSKVAVPEDELIELLEQLREAIPEEVERANNILADSENMLRQARSDADAMVLQARAQAEEIIKTAEEERQKLLSHESIFQDAERQGAELKAAALKENAEIRGKAQEFANQTRADILKYANDVLNYLNDTLVSTHGSIQANMENIAKELEKAQAGMDVPVEQTK